MHAAEQPLCGRTDGPWLIYACVSLPFNQTRFGHETITTTIDTYGHHLQCARRQMPPISANTMNSALSSISLGGPEPATGSSRSGLLPDAAH